MVIVQIIQNFYFHKRKKTVWYKLGTYSTTELLWKRCLYNSLRLYAGWNDITLLVGLVLAASKKDGFMRCVLESSTKKKRHPWYTVHEDPFFR